MDLEKSGNLISELRKAKGLTQKQIADMLGVVPKTVSKWETGHGFPDVSTITILAEALGVSAETILSGSLLQNRKEIGNMKKINFYVCPDCGAFMQGSGNMKLTCCGKQLEPLKALKPDTEHTLNISEIEDDFYITFNHEMTKKHYISFISCVTYDKELTVKLYPEQSSSARFPKLYGSTLYYYCSEHGLSEYKNTKH